MINEIAEFKAYTEAPIYKRDNKNDNCFLGSFTREGIQGFEGFPRVLTIISRGYMFKNGSADIDSPRRAAWLEEARGAAACRGGGGGCAAWSLSGRCPLRFPWQLRLSGAVEPQSELHCPRYALSLSAQHQRHDRHRTGGL